MLPAAQGNKAMCSLLMLSAIALAMPTAARHLPGDAVTAASLLKMSHAISILMVVLCAPRPESPAPKLDLRGHKREASRALRF